MKTWKALVLGGGGSTGEFQIGALPVICSHYDHMDMFIGVGVGSLHASVLAQYESLSEGAKVLLNFWNQLKETSDILSAPFYGSDIATLLALASDQAWARDGAYNNKKLKKIIDQYVSWEDLADKNNWAIRMTSLSDGQLYTVSNIKELLELSNRNDHLIQFSLDPDDSTFFGNKLTDVITAAGSVPLMLPPVDIFDHRFVEGGLRDFTPLELAVQAFNIANVDNSYDNAQFIVIDNYRREVEYETPELLDSGNEIILRAIKIMTVEMAQNDINKGKDLIRQSNIDSIVIQIQPSVDHRMHPMNFDDLEVRKKQRRHGAERAYIALQEHNIPPYFSKSGFGTFTTKSSITEDEVNAILQAAKLDPESTKYTLDPSINLEPNDDYAKRYHPIDKSKVLYPTSLNELKSIIKSRATSNIKIKGLGSGYAFSNILETSGTQISLDKLKNIYSPIRSQLKDPSQNNKLIEFQAGATIQDLNHKLWPIGRTLLNQPGYEYLNYYGVCTVGGHGSGLQLGPIANAIRSMHLITLDAVSYTHLTLPTNREV